MIAFAPYGGKKMVPYQENTLWWNKAWWWSVIKKVSRTKWIFLPYGENNQQMLYMYFFVLWSELWKMILYSAKYIHGQSIILTSFWHFPKSSLFMKWTLENDIVRANIYMTFEVYYLNKFWHFSKVIEIIMSIEPISVTSEYPQDDGWDRCC